METIKKVHTRYGVIEYVFKEENNTGDFYETFLKYTKKRAPWRRVEDFLKMSLPKAAAELKRAHNAIPFRHVEKKRTLLHRGHELASRNDFYLYEGVHFIGLGLNEKSYIREMNIWGRKRKLWATKTDWYVHNVAANNGYELALW